MVKKGRHRRYEEARAVKRTTTTSTSTTTTSTTTTTAPPIVAPAGLGTGARGPEVQELENRLHAQCGAEPGLEHASWCMHDALEDEEEG